MSESDIRRVALSAATFALPHHTQVRDSCSQCPQWVESGFYEFLFCAGPRYLLIFNWVIQGDCYV
jgi:hypothetical protein